jgi:S-adenosylmethionine uptake transporter
MDAAMKGLSLSVGLFNALFWRAVAGSAIGLVLTLLLRLPRPSRAALRIHLVRGSVVAVMAGLFFWALMRMPMAEAIALSFIAPLIALYLAALLLGERIGRGAIVASLLGLLGVAVILSARVQGHYGWDVLQGAVAVLASAVLFAWNLILQRQQAQVASPVEVAFYQHLVMLGVYLLFALVGRIAPLPTAIALPTAHGAALVLLAAGLAFTSLTALSWAYARAEAQRLIPVEYSAFAWAAIVGWLAFDEALSVTTLAGAALIVAGCLVAARARPAEPPPAEPPHVEPGVA